MLEVSPPVGRSGDDDPSGRVTYQRWVAGVVSPTMKVFLAIVPKFFLFSEQIQALGSDTM